MRKMIIASLTAAVIATTAFSTYVPQEAFSALYYSKISYCSPANIASWDCMPCRQYHPQVVSPTVIEGDYESQGYIGYNPTDNQIVIAFRGSSNLPNWIANLDFGKVPYPLCSGCEVHQGFYNIWLGQKQFMSEPLQNLTKAHPTATIFVTGHSLRAAMAAHAAVDIAHTYPGRIVHVYNFGEPRIGNQAFAQFATTVLATGKQYRLTHKADPVPHLPPKSWGFLHIPHELWYDNNGNSTYKNCNDSGSAEDPTCSDSTIPIGFSDHLKYLGMCTGCDCTNFEAELQAMPSLLMPKDYVRSPEEVRLM